MGLYPKVEKATIADARTPKKFRSAVWFVDSSYGNDGWLGDRREKPLATIVEALTRCSHEHMDTIHVLQRVHVGDTYPIEVNIQAVHIIGNPPPYRGMCPGTQLNVGGTDTGAIFTMNGNDQRLENFEIRGGASYPCVNFATGWETQRISLINLYLAVGTYGIQTGGVQTPNHKLAIVDCYFEGSLSVGGIYYASNGSWNLFLRNAFDQVPGPQMHFTSAGGTAAGRIIDNSFSLDSDTNGEAISFLGSEARYFIDGNVAADEGITDPSNSPYGDNQNPSANHWGVNWRGNTVIDPIAL